MTDQHARRTRGRRSTVLVALASVAGLSLITACSTAHLDDAAGAEDHRPTGQSVSFTSQGDPIVNAVQDDTLSTQPVEPGLTWEGDPISAHAPEGVSFAETNPAAYSAEGRRIAFVGTESAGPGKDLDAKAGIYVMDADGGNAKRVTDLVQARSDLAISADGHRIAFTDSATSGNGATFLYLVDADGSHRALLTKEPGGDRAPAFSRDGKRVVFCSTRDTDQAEIYVVDVDGGGLKRLTTDEAEDCHPSFSPDGRMIAFDSIRHDDSATGGGSGIFVMKADGGAVKRLTESPGDDTRPLFSPQGEKMVFFRAVGAPEGVYTMAPDGSGQKRLYRFPE